MRSRLSKRGRIEIDGVLLSHGRLRTNQAAVLLLLLLLLFFFLLLLLLLLVLLVYLLEAKEFQHDEGL